MHTQVGCKTTCRCGVPTRKRGNTTTDLRGVQGCNYYLIGLCWQDRGCTSLYQGRSGLNQGFLINLPRFTLTKRTGLNWFGLTKGGVHLFFRGRTCLYLLEIPTSPGPTTTTVSTSLPLTTSQTGRKMAPLQSSGVLPTCGLLLLLLGLLRLLRLLGLLRGILLLLLMRVLLFCFGVYMMHATLTRGLVCVCVSPIFATHPSTITATTRAGSSPTTTHATNLTRPGGSLNPRTTRTPTGGPTTTPIPILLAISCKMPD